MSRPRLIIADDHEMVRTALRLVLAQANAAEVVATCGDCDSAWRLVGEQAPDVVLMDVELPDGDGIALTARIRAAYPAVKVLVLTSRLEEEVERRAFAAGAQGFLLKTKAATELVAAVGRMGAKQGGPAEPPLSVGAAAFDLAHASAAAVGLPKRESEVLARVLAGRRNKEIAVELGLSVKTVETYRARLMKRFGCTSPAELARHAIRHGLATA